MTTPPAINAPERREAVLRDPKEIPAAIELWFFRDLGETQRRQLFDWCGFPGVEANGEDLQRKLLARVLALLTPTSSGEREKALEEAAVVAECHADDRGGRDHPFDWHDGYLDGTRGAAKAIRALIPTPTTVEEPKV